LYDLRNIYYLLDRNFQIRIRFLEGSDKVIDGGMSDDIFMSVDFEMCICPRFMESRFGDLFSQFRERSAPKLALV
jgi:hypothetical protein